MAGKNKPESKIHMRQAAFADMQEITNLYRGTVNTVNSKDYTPEQISVWADGAVNYPRWEKAIKDQFFVLAEIEGKLAGFSSIAIDGYLDFMYVNKDYQRCGVATALLAEIESKAREQKNAEIYSHVSKTAKGFFLKMGYEHKENLRDMYKGVLFINALMVKKI